MAAKATTTTATSSSPSRRDPDPPPPSPSCSAVPPLARWSSSSSSSSGAPGTRRRRRSQRERERPATTSTATVKSTMATATTAKAAGRGRKAAPRRTRSRLLLATLALAGSLVGAFLARGRTRTSSRRSSGIAAPVCPSASDDGDGGESSDRACPAVDAGEEGESSRASSPHRGKVLGPDVRAAELEAAYRSIKAEYEALALRPTSAERWRTISSHADGSEVALLERPDDPSCPYVRMTSVLPASVEEVWDFLDLKNWEDSMPSMDPFYESLTVFDDYKHKGVEMKLARKRTKRIATFGKRDFTFVSVSDRPKSDGARVSGTVSVLTDRIPRERGYVRAYQDSVAFYEALEDDVGDGDEEGEMVRGGGASPRMKLTIVFRLDLNDSREGGEGGYVPMWIYVKTVGATGMASVQNMKSKLLEMRKERAGVVGDGNWLAKVPASLQRMKRRLETMRGEDQGADEGDDEPSCDGSWLGRFRGNSTGKC